MKSNVTNEDVKTLQKIQKKLLGHELPKDITRDSLETTPLSELMNEYYQTYLQYHDEIRNEELRDKVGVDFVKGAFIGVFVGLIISWIDGGDIFRIVIVGGLIGGVVGALAPPIIDIIIRYSEKNNF